MNQNISNYTFTPVLTYTCDKNTIPKFMKMFEQLMNLNHCPHMRIHGDLNTRNFTYEVKEGCPFKRLLQKIKLRTERINIWHKCTNEFPDDPDKWDLKNNSYHVVFIDTEDNDNHSYCPGYYKIRDAHIYNFKEWKRYITSAKYWAFYEDFIKLIAPPIQGEFEI